ncbi:MAG: gas vesicle protein GvpG [Synechococcales cyanobacterium K44_A2020_017]|jgi:hypothetical protein|uniref:gas vesicle protein GvpG n=1 Tax=Leptolyngbya sp. CCY15150 TaxID=2767772 RepID=UPI00194FD8C0|nr:gas vesicle protein GvpG [Leptolyngbya sp. CCY15150]MBF2087363.1 gas vesicle protein GvpG [Synechococcales cyanobacterium K32_A2020_035]MBF2096546.1 gas vesicle protein GvpG [Synechococcales cyanobacterium K44_A2020_017]
MFFDLLISPITAPLKGLSWIGEKILEQADTQLDDTENLKKQLLELQLRFDMGDLEEEEFELQEEELLLAIQAMEDEARRNAAEDDEE